MYGTVEYMQQGAPRRASYWTSERRLLGIEQLKNARDFARQREGSRLSIFPKTSELITQDIERAHRLEERLGIIAINNSNFAREE